METIFGITPPIGYQWLIDKGLVGFDAFTQLQPWYYIKQEEFFWANERWKDVTNERLLVFARRQDCDDFACFIVGKNNAIEGVALIHGWTEAGFDVVQQFSDFWEWLKQVIQDISEVAKT